MLGKNSHTIDYHRIEIKICSKRAVQQQYHITLKDIFFTSEAEVLIFLLIFNSSLKYNSKYVHYSI